MTSVKPIYGGEYALAIKGIVVRGPSEPIRATWTKSVFSIVSQGTEQWHLRLSARSNDIFPLGYMNVGRLSDKQYIVSPTPHCATFSPRTRGCLRANATIDQITIGRFQLVAASALRAANVPIGHQQYVTVIGSGSVAVGMIFELARLGLTSVDLVTKRVHQLSRLLAKFPWVRVRHPDEATVGELVFDCVGTGESIGTALRLCAPRGTVGILGSPREPVTLPIYNFHRYGCKLVGLHELMLDGSSRQELFLEIVAWLSDDKLAPSLVNLVQSHDGHDLPTAYESLRGRSTSGIFHILKWSK